MNYWTDGTTKAKTIKAKRTIKGLILLRAISGSSGFYLAY